MSEQLARTALAKIEDLRRRLIQRLDEAIEGVILSIAAGLAAQQQAGTYSPALWNITIGTGGGVLNTAEYVFVGGPNVGDKGVLHVTGRIQLGTSSSAVSTPTGVSPPTGFQFSGYMGYIPVGMARLVDAAPSAYAAYAGCFLDTTTRVAFNTFRADTSTVQELGMTSLIPWTWTGNDRIDYAYTVAAVRV